jgi:hypothetical protein
MTYQELKQLPNDSYIIVEYKAKKYKYYLSILTPELWDFLTAVASTIETPKTNEK